MGGLAEQGGMLSLGLIDLSEDVGAPTARCEDRQNRVIERAREQLVAEALDRVVGSDDAADDDRLGAKDGRDVRPVEVPVGSVRREPEFLMQFRRDLPQEEESGGVKEFRIRERARAT